MKDSYIQILSFFILLIVSVSCTENKESINENKEVSKEDKIIQTINDCGCTPPEDLIMQKILDINHKRDSSAHYVMNISSDSISSDLKAILDSTPIGRFIEIKKLPSLGLLPSGGSSEQNNCNTNQSLRDNSSRLQTQLINYSICIKKCSKDDEMINFALARLLFPEITSEEYKKIVDNKPIETNTKSDISELTETKSVNLSQLENINHIKDSTVLVLTSFMKTGKFKAMESLIQEEYIKQVNSLQANFKVDSSRLANREKSFDSSYIMQQIKHRVSVIDTLTKMK